MSGKLDDYLRFNETALNLRAQRQQVLASNIANADTPNYKARDIDFNSTLQAALDKKTSAQSSSQTPLTMTAPPHMPGSADGTEDATLLYRGVIQGSADNNTVDMDVERAQFADNALRYEAGLTMVSMQIKNMLAAIQGGN
jgi:flagellar basal-body rod protein FlgB